MVAKIISGKSIKGALNYNEKKVKEDKANLLNAVEFPTEDLSFNEKLHRFLLLTVQNRRSKTNAVHISLNFDPSEKLNKETLCAIADAYLNEIGFKGQPYLLYEHFDAAHQHLHIVTTNIKNGGKRIPLHYIGENQSEKARKEIEKEFGLVPAESKEKHQSEGIKPVPEKIVYGKSQTKSAVSNVVRTVINEYKYTSLAELNAVLGQYNVTAYRGEEGSKMYEKKGLTYCVLDGQGERIGVPIKASSIYTRPTLPNLEKKFADNEKQRLRYREQLKSNIDNTLSSSFIPDKETLTIELAKKNIKIVFRQNETKVYGITFIDNNSKTVFNGSDVGKAYTAKAILERIGIEGMLQHNEQKKNEQFVEKTFKETNYSKGIAVSLATLYAKGLRIRVAEKEDGEMEILMGNRYSIEKNYTTANKKITAWLGSNNVIPHVIDRLNKEFNDKDYKNSVDILFINRVAAFIKNVLANETYMQAPTVSPDPKKKKRRKPNW